MIHCKSLIGCTSKVVEEVFFPYVHFIFPSRGGGAAAGAGGS
jgi:hypothetical protein